MIDVLSGFTGFCAGAVSGSALCAFLIALGVISKSALSLGLYGKEKYAAGAAAAGGVFGSAMTLYGFRLYSCSFLAGAFGLFSGIYVGIFVACLTEVVSLIPLLKRFIVLRALIALLLIALAAGKLTGSLFYWLYGEY